MGTWRLVDRPPNTIPIANKWVFAKKRNKQGQFTKYKARLVAKGYAQRLGYNYVKMHSPVVHLETICLILAIAAIKGLVIQQMDVKGAYCRMHCVRAYMPVFAHVHLCLSVSLD